MDIFEKLTQLANSLDKRGFYKEADEIDNIIKIAITTEFAQPTVWPAYYGDKGKVPLKYRKLKKTIYDIRSELLGPNASIGSFDRDVIRALKKQYPYILKQIEDNKRSGKQMLAKDILSSIKEQKQYYNFANRNIPESETALNLNQGEASVARKTDQLPDGPRGGLTGQEQLLSPDRIPRPGPQPTLRDTQENPYDFANKGVSGLDLDSWLNEPSTAKKTNQPPIGPRGGPKGREYLLPFEKMPRPGKPDITQWELSQPRSPTL